ncbi:MAG TPA: HAD family hydrolase [Candidatus Gastranaerophilales bacterium]|nr:HAD family hydrolase [Candidatus Gastranaerophilales bacterium]
MQIDNSWTLFLDRDGVINKRLVDDYVKNIDEFEFLPGTKEAIAKLSGIFGKVFVVTNQRGIAKQLMTVEDLNIINDFMLKEVEKAGGKIDKVYFCPHERDVNCGCRKPDIGMAFQAKKDFSSVDFSKSIMVGDSLSDLAFGKNAGMITVYITKNEFEGIKADSLLEFANIIERKTL